MNEGKNEWMNEWTKGSRPSAAETTVKALKRLAFS